MQPLIIMLGYKKRSGKDTFASLLFDELKDYKVQVLSFATPMKEILVNSLELSLEELEDLKNTESYLQQWYLDDSFASISYRELLQNFGQEMKRYFGDNVWVDLLKQQIKPDTQVVIISDFRYFIEFKGLDETYSNIYTIRINGIDKNIDNHSSEIELDNFIFDKVIENDFVLQNFKKKAKEVANELKLRIT